MHANPFQILLLYQKFHGTWPVGGKRIEGVVCRPHFVMFSAAAIVYSKRKFCYSSLAFKRPERLRTPCQTLLMQLYGYANGLVKSYHRVLPSRPPTQRNPLAKTEAAIGTAKNPRIFFANLSTGLKDRDAPGALEAMGGTGLGRGGLVWFARMKKTRGRRTTRA